MTKTADKLIDFWGGVDIASINDRLYGIKRYCGLGLSVAEHSILVAAMCHRDKGRPAPELMLACLLHDAPEAFTGDIAAPLKDDIVSRTTAIRDTEAVILKAIYDSLFIVKDDAFRRRAFDTVANTKIIVHSYDMEARDIEAKNLYGIAENGFHEMFFHADIVKPFRASIIKESYSIYEEWLLMVRHFVQQIKEQ